MTNRIIKSYDNKLLLKALVDRDTTISYASQIISNTYAYSDEDIKRFKAYQKLSQFEKDLLYLYSIAPVAEIANLYGVTKQYVYKMTKKITTKLNERI